MKLKNLTKLVLHQSGPIRNNIAWAEVTQLTHLDIYYSEQTNTYATAEIELAKLRLPNLRFLQLANVILNERGLARLLEKAQNGQTELEGFPKLEFLSLRRSFLTANNSVDSLLFLLRNTENLKTLDLQGCYRYDYEDILAALGKAWISEKYRKNRFKQQLVDFESRALKPDYSSH